MSIVQVRNAITTGLAAYLGVKVVLQDQASPELPEPYATYSMTAQYIPISPFGDHAITSDEDEAIDTRTEQAHATISITFCSQNRWSKSSTNQDIYILGDDEAQELAILARGWFLHSGQLYLTQHGVAVVDVTNSANRTTIEINEAARRYGFDVRVRYTIQDVRVDPTIERAVFDSVYTRQEDD